MQFRGKAEAEIRRIRSGRARRPWYCWREVCRGLAWTISALFDALPIRASLSGITTSPTRVGPTRRPCMSGSRPVIGARPSRTSYSRSRSPPDGLAGRSQRSVSRRGHIGRQGPRQAAWAGMLCSRVSASGTAEAYLSRPGSFHRFDVQRLDEFDVTIGNYHLSRVECHDDGDLCLWHRACSFRTRNSARSYYRSSSWES